MTLNTTRFLYNNRNITIYSKDPVKVEQINYNIPFLYSEPNDIIFNYIENADMYNITIKSVSYNNEKLFLKGENDNIMEFDLIEEYSKELTCFISKSKIQKLLTVNEEKFKVVTIIDNYGTLEFENVLPVTIKSLVDEKENLTITYLKLLTNVTEVGATYTYQTNIYEASEFVTGKYLNCIFKKIDNNPLLMICTAEKEEDYTYGNITEEVYLDDIHYKYNIILGPLENNEVVHIAGLGTQIQSVSPSIINIIFEEYITLDFITDSPELINGIKFNPDSNDVFECENLVGIKRCIIPV